MKKKRLYRSISEKRQIVEETLVAGSSVSIVARRHEVNANQVFAWRRAYQQGRLTNEPKAETNEPQGWIPLGILGPPALTDTASSSPPPPSICPPSSLEAAHTQITIDLPRGIHVRIAGAVRLPVLRDVLQLVERLA